MALDDCPPALGGNLVPRGVDEQPRVGPDALIFLSRHLQHLHARLLGALADEWQRLEARRCDRGAGTDLFVGVAEDVVVEGDTLGAPAPNVVLRLLFGFHPVCIATRTAAKPARDRTIPACCSHQAGTSPLPAGVSARLPHWMRSRASQ